MTDPIPDLPERRPPGPSECDPEDLVVSIFDIEQVGAGFQEKGFSGREMARILVNHARNESDPQTSLAAIGKLMQLSRTAVQLSGREETQRSLSHVQEGNATHQLEAARRVLVKTQKRPQLNEAVGIRVIGELPSKVPDVVDALDEGPIAHPQHPEGGARPVEPLSGDED